MGRIWEDAASILEAASAAGPGETSDIVILIDRQNGIRIVNAGGRELDALYREYQAASAYSVKRTARSVEVEARDGENRCVLKRAIGGELPFGAVGGIPQHLIRPECDWFGVIGAACAVGCGDGSDRLSRGTPYQVRRLAEGSSRIRGKSQSTGQAAVLYPL